VSREPYAVLEEAEIVEGAKRSTLEELTHLSVAADKVIVF